MNAPSRCAGAIPASALRGEPFDLTEELGAIPATAVRFEEASQIIWAARLDFPDREVGQRTWSTEISVYSDGQSVRFSSRLTNITRGDNPSYTPSIPGVVKLVSGVLSAEFDGFPISTDPFDVNEHTYADFEYLLLNKNRRLPILAFSRREDDSLPFDPLIAANKLCGVAHVVIIDADASWQLTGAFGRRFSVFGGAIRLYWPQFDPDAEEPFRHPLQLANPDLELDSYLEDVSRRIIPQTFIRPPTEHSFWRVTEVRSKLSKQNRESANNATDYKNIKTLAEELQKGLSASEQQRQDDAEAAQALLDEAAESLSRSEELRTELESDVARMRTKIQALSKARATGAVTTDERLTSYDLFESWADSTLGEHIEVLNRAVRELEKHGHPDVIAKMESALLALRDYYVPMKTIGGIEKRRAFEAECARIGIEESACFAQKDNIKAYPEYRVKYDGRQIWLDRHIKFGRGYNLRDMFRIYFTWDEQTSTIVVGHMPTHLDNNNTQ